MTNHELRAGVYGAGTALFGFPAVNAMVNAGVERSAMLRSTLENEPELTTRVMTAATDAAANATGNSLVDGVFIVGYACLAGFFAGRTLYHGTRQPTNEE